MKNPMKSSVDCSDVPVDNYIGTSSEHSTGAACADVPMMRSKAPMCVRARVCAREIIGTIGTSAHPNVYAGFNVPITIKHRNIIGTTNESAYA